MAGAAGRGSLRLGDHPRAHSFGNGPKGRAAPPPPSGPLPSRYLESQQEGATAPWGPRGAPEEQEDESKPRTPSGPQCLVPGTESDPTHCPRPAFIGLGPLPQLDSERGCNGEGLS